ncbi:MAG: DUF433 domain-containing protein [Candidatus Hydrogenedentes bacterium]|nr:DUF433 domain-containing protein [Candidatus Hydrogenedentota bacterium]
MALNDRIEWNPEVLAGKPVIRGTRLAVEFIVELLAQGWTYDDVLRNYPGIQIEDIQACLQYASDVLHAEKLYPVGV